MDVERRSTQSRKARYALSRGPNSCRGVLPLMPARSRPVPGNPERQLVRFPRAEPEWDRGRHRPGRARVHERRRRRRQSLVVRAAASGEDLAQTGRHSACSGVAVHFSRCRAAPPERRSSLRLGLPRPEQSHDPFESSRSPAQAGLPGVTRPSPSRRRAALTGSRVRGGPPGPGRGGGPPCRNTSAGPGACRSGETRTGDPLAQAQRASKGPRRGRARVRFGQRQAP
jgi:hypothetical protein